MNQTKTDISLAITNLRVALIYDRVNTSYGGAEQVVLSLKSLFPQAVLITSVYNRNKAKWANIFGHIRVSFLNKIPLANTHHQWFLPLMPLAFESHDLNEFDLIISITSAEAKGVITKPNQLHLCYLLTPPRYLYDFRSDYLKSRWFLNWFPFKQFSKTALRYLAWWDQAAINRPDLIIPISELVKSRVKNHYFLNIHDPIYPPIDMIDFETDDQALEKFNLPSQFNLIVSRLVFYKRVDLAIRSSLQIGEDLVIVGEGCEMKRLKRLAKNVSKTSQAKVIFLNSQPQPVVNSLMKKAKLFLSPGVDDFGLSPLQANLFGTPSLINKQSGVAEIFDKLGYGVVITDTTISQIIKKMHQASLLTKKSDNISRVTQELSSKRFHQQILSTINNHLLIKK